MTTTIDDTLSPPYLEAETQVREAVRNHRQVRAAYRGGLRAEEQSWVTVRQASRSAIRAAYLASVGRRIDLIALLRQRDKEGRPIWTVADPTRRIGYANGMVEGDGDVRIGKGYRQDHYGSIRTKRPCGEGKSYHPAGMPPLPVRAREIATDPSVRKRAKWVGVLYQPDSWTEVDPDPAIVVEWDDRPGEYYCLAVWGGDRGQIEEFLH